jgi:hypothetical protein
MWDIRNVTYWDVDKAAGVLAASVLNTRLGQWLEPIPVERAKQLSRYLYAVVEDAMGRGRARLLEERGDAVAAAVWLPCAASVSTACPAVAGDGFTRRIGQLLAVAEQPHLPVEHLRLAALGVTTWRQRHGLATALLAEADPGEAPCMLAVDDATAALGSRCDYQRFGQAGALTSENVVQPMMHTVRGLPTPARSTGWNRYSASVPAMPATSGVR